MAQQDIRHYQAPNGVVDIRSYPVTASQAFLEGEPVTLTNAGTLSECSDDPARVTGIAAHKSSDVDGTDLGVGTPISVYGTDPSQVFITKKFATDGDGTAATPALTNVGDLAGLDLNAGVWTLDIGQDNVICEILGVQDISGRDLGDPNLLAGTGVWVLFRFI
jgi:hypothetical protein